MIESAEQALAALANRDALIALQNPETSGHGQRPNDSDEGADRSPDPHVETSDRDDSLVASPASDPIGTSSAIPSPAHTSLHRRSSSN